MKIIDIPAGQGSEQWHAHRRAHFNASDAPAMMGCSPYETRSQLLHRLYCERHGLPQPGHDAATLALFADGHRAEALARPLAERLLDEDLYPLVKANGQFSASLDGQTLMGDIDWEHKLLRDDLRALIPPGEADAPVLAGPDVGRALPLFHRAQMAHQHHCSGARRTLFSATAWDADGRLLDERHCWYERDEALIAQVVAGWSQFEQDLAAYIPPPAAEVVVADPIESLPTVAVRIDGSLAVQSNLDLFEQRLRAYIDRIPAKPTTDLDFANCAAAVKALDEAEKALKRAEESALAQIREVEALRTRVRTLDELMRTKRLVTNRIVEQRKDELRLAEVRRGADALAEYVSALNARFGGLYVSAAGGFAHVIKGLKTLDSIRNAIDTELARAKIEADRAGERIEANLSTIAAAGLPAIFADRRDLVLKDPEAVQAIVAQRVAEHRAAEERRLEAERARIRAEEAARIEREVAELERQRVEAEQRAAVEAAQVYESRVAREAAAIGAHIKERLAAVQACRPEDRAMLATPAGVELVQAVTSALRQDGTPKPVISVELDNSPPAPMPPPDEPATLLLGVIAARLGFPLRGDFIGGTLGIEPAGRQKAAALYRESDWPRIKAALVRHIGGLA